MTGQNRDDMMSAVIDWLPRGLVAFLWFLAVVDALAGGLVDLEQPAAQGVYSGIQTVRGWACDVASVTVDIDGQRFGEIPTGGPRRDVAAVYPECGDAAGFAFALNYGGLPDGAHTLTLTAGGVRIERAFSVTGYASDFVYARDVDPRDVAAIPGFDDTFWLSGIRLSGAEYRILMRWDEAMQNFTPQSIETATDAPPDPCGFSPPAPGC